MPETTPEPRKPRVCPFCEGKDVVAETHDVDTEMVETSGLLFPGPAEGRVITGVTLTITHASGQQCRGTPTPE